MAWRSDDLNSLIFPGSTAPLGKSAIFENHDCVPSSGHSAPVVGSFERVKLGVAVSYIDSLANYAAC